MKLTLLLTLVMGIVPLQIILVLHIRTKSLASHDRQTNEHDL